MKVPLLEYLDKLEKKDRADIAFCSEPAKCSEHHEIPVRLALIAKLRELANFASAYWPHIFGEDAPLYIEVPE